MEEERERERERERRMGGKSLRGILYQSVRFSDLISPSAPTKLYNSTRRPRPDILIGGVRRTPSASMAMAGSAAGARRAATRILLMEFSCWEERWRRRETAAAAAAAVDLGAQIALTFRTFPRPSAAHQSPLERRERPKPKLLLSAET